MERVSVSGKELSSRKRKGKSAGQPRPTLTARTDPELAVEDPGLPSR
jgi:hypothetical protein